MTNIIETAWLASAPFFVVFYVYRKRFFDRLFWPTSRPLQFVSATVCFAMVTAAAVGKLSGNRLEVAGTELIVWLGFVFLLNCWIQIIYLWRHSGDKSILPPEDHST
jgi:hypothetical protein